MDPFTAAIVAAVTAGLTQGATAVGKTVLLDGYQRLKAVLAERFGQGSEVVAAVRGVEERPDSPARRAVLEEEAQRSGAAADEELLGVARDLLARFQQDPDVAASVQQAVGSYIAQADRHGHAEVNVNRPEG